MDYAHDLKYFHEESKDRYIILFSIPTEAPKVQNEFIIMDDRIAKVFLYNKKRPVKSIYQVLFIIEDIHQPLQ